jgi:hypothetical protein
MAAGRLHRLSRVAGPFGRESSLESRRLAGGRVAQWLRDRQEVAFAVVEPRRQLAVAVGRGVVALHLCDAVRGLQARVVDVVERDTTSSEFRSSHFDVVNRERELGVVA